MPVCPECDSEPCCCERQRDLIAADERAFNESRLGCFTGTNILDAARAGDEAEIKRLLDLPVEEGGLKLLRLVVTD